MIGSFPVTGGTTSTAGGYTFHTYTSSGTISAPVAKGSVDILIVAGGGGGGDYGVSGESVGGPASVGGGGAGGTGGTPDGAAGTANTGGGGGGAENGTGGAGGSGIVIFRYET